MNYNSVFDQALDVLRKNNNRQPQRWQNIAQQMGFRMETLNQEDAELLHDAIEDATIHYDNDYVLDLHDALEVDKQDTDFEKFFKS